MKLKLTFCGLIYLCTVSAGFATDPVDVMGVSIGMPAAELKQLIQAKGWHCDQVEQTVFRCQTQDAGVSKQDIGIQVASALPNTPVVAMKVSFSTLENPVPSLAQKFGRPGRANGADATWVLSNGSLLELQSGGSDHILMMSDRALMNADAEAQLKRTVPYSTPKF